MPNILLCLCIPQSKYTEVCSQCMPIRLANLLQHVVVNAEVDNSVGFCAQKDIKSKSTGIKEFVFDKQFKNSIFSLNCGRELCPTNLVEV